MRTPFVWYLIPSPGEAGDAGPKTGRYAGAAAVAPRDGIDAVHPL